MRLVLALNCLFLCLATGRTQEPNVGVKVYRETVSSVVWIQSTRTKGLATGSGTLIDVDRKLVLTNFHVVEDNPKAIVMFPELKDGKPIAERRYYQDRAKRFGIPGKVIALNRSADLALIELESLPEGVKAVRLALTSPASGETIHSIGNAGSSGALWGYVRGTVRAVYRKKWQAKLSDTKVISFEAKIIEADSPTNAGDSGGPLLNDAGELIGVTQGGATNANSVSYFVDVSEVRELLKAKRITLGEMSKEETPKEVKRTKPIPPKDDAKLFQPKALASLEPELSYLFVHGIEVIIETHPKAPLELAAKFAKANAETRQKLVRDWAEQRLTELKSDGIIILICKEPRVYHVHGHAAIAGKIKDVSKVMPKVTDAILNGLKTNNYDKSLAEALRLLRDNINQDKK